MEYILDCTRVRSLSELHGELAALLSFPDYYGANLDALYDCLTDMAVTLRITHWDALEEAIGIPRCITFKRVLQAAAEESRFQYIIE